jgi:putative addiction module antidote
MYTLKIRKIGNSLGATLPQEVLKKLNISEGDSIFLTETPDGVQITPYDPDFADSMRAFAETRKKYRNALHELAR